MSRTGTRSTRRAVVLTAAAAVLLAGSAASAAPAPTAPRTTVEVYDSFSAPRGYTLADYQARWSTLYGPLEMANADTRSFTGDKFSVSAVPFRLGADSSVFDHLKYIAISTRSFPVPEVGAVEISSRISAETPGTQPGRVVRGTYTATGAPYAAATLEGQQAGAVMNVVDFSTGQLFDWFVSGSTAFALIERLPSNVTGSPEYVGPATMYTQIVEEVPVGPGTHEVAIRFSRGAAGVGSVDYLLDGEQIARVDHVGVPLDRQGVDYTGIYPSLGPGEELGSRIDSLAIGHGLFSLLDAFPFQHPDAPALHVSIPLSERLFGQGARATFDHFRVKTTR